MTGGAATPATTASRIRDPDSVAVVRTRMLPIVAAAALAVTLTACTPQVENETPPTSSQHSATEGAATGTGSALSELAPTWEGVASDPMTPEEYRDAFMSGLTPHEDRFLDLEGALALHTAAAAAFPFALPAGWSFPADPGYYDRPEDGDNWSSKLILMRVWEYWNYANVAEARAAWEAGDEDAALGYLDIVREGFLSPVFPVNYDGVPEDWYEGSHGAFRDGDFAGFEQWVVNPFPWTPRGS